METFWSWKHHISNTDKDCSGYTKIRANSIEEAQQKAEKHYKYDFFHSTFSVSTINHDGKQGVLNTGPILPPGKKKKVYEAYHYFHDLPESMQQLVYDHCRDNNDDWRGKSKEELQAKQAKHKQWKADRKAGKLKTRNSILELVGGKAWSLTS